nr:ERF family protein [Acidobacteriota bacterium]
TLAIAYTFYAPDGSNIRAVVVGEAMDSGDKSSNKAMSAALKYALLQIFCVPTEANEDADAQSHEIKPKAASVSRYEPVKIEARFEEAASPTSFWSLQREYNIPKEQAQTLATAHGQDWKTAVAKLKALIPEADREQAKAAA